MVGFILVATVMVSRPIPPLSSFAWMSGHWLAREGDAQLEEFWSGFDADLVLGCSRSTKHGRVEFCELMRLERTETELTFQAFQAMERKLTGGGAFRMSRFGKGEIVFEYPTNPYPRLIIYRKSGKDAMTSRIEGTDEAGKPVFHESHWVRSKS